MGIIITATDFSEVAENAVHYACGLAGDQKASVTVLHSYMIPVSFNDNPMPVMPIEECRLIAEEHMSLLIAKLQIAYPDIILNSQISFGDITDSLIEYADEVKPWLIVVGNSSSEDNNFWLGSNLISELRNLPYIVLAISPETKYKKVSKICLACDVKNVNHHMPGEVLVGLVQKTAASLHVLNVDHNDQTFNLDTPVESTALHAMLKMVNPQYHYIDNPDIEEGIKSFVTENDVDWLVVTPHKHGFFENLFHKSHTKAIVRKIHIPIVALHEL